MLKVVVSTSMHGYIYISMIDLQQDNSIKTSNWNHVEVTNIDS